MIGAKRFMPFSNNRAPKVEGRSRPMRRTTDTSNVNDKTDCECGPKKVKVTISEFVRCITVIFVWHVGASSINYSVVHRKIRLTYTQVREYLITLLPLILQIWLTSNSSITL